MNDLELRLDRREFSLCSLDQLDKYGREIWSTENRGKLIGRVFLRGQRCKLLGPGNHDGLIHVLFDDLVAPDCAADYFRNLTPLELLAEAADCAQEQK